MSLELTNSQIKDFNELEPMLCVFRPTWEHSRTRLLPNRSLAFFTGNQFGKTSTRAHWYVERLFSIYPVPKRNVFYFECERRNKDDLAPHGYHVLRFPESASEIQGWERGTWNVVNRPKEPVCPYCGGKIVIHKRQSRIFRFAAENLPSDKGKSGGTSSEIKNSVYPALKKWLPDCLIKRNDRGVAQDITIRTPSVTLVDPWDGHEFYGEKYVGEDVIWEFVSYNQTTQAGAGVQRVSCLIDEECDWDFNEEQKPRLLAEDGDVIYTLTPAMGMTWTYDNIHELGSIYIRTDAVKEFLSKHEHRDAKNFEFNDAGKDVVVVQCATDDNPTLSKAIIDAEYSQINDPDGTIIPTRRYGVFKQASGRIFKDFDWRVHVINHKEHEITDDVLSCWTLGRGIDFHESNPWACVWAAVSDQDEMFVFREIMPSPEKMVVAQICNEIARLSGMMRFDLNLIDPLSNKRQPSTGKTSLEDINETFYNLRHGRPVKGLTAQNECMGGFWETWKTQGLVGRDAIKARLANSLKCGRPFNNRVAGDSGPVYLPTIWIFDRCPETARSLKHWRLESWKDKSAAVNKDRKETPAQKWSHFPTALEGLLKDKRFCAKIKRGGYKSAAPKYFRKVS